MELNRLPRDLLILIFDRLDFASLIALHSTFDRLLQKSLHAPNAIRFLEPSNFIWPIPGEHWHFLKSIRDISTLKLCNRWKLELQSLGLLSLWNPLEIECDEHVVNADHFSSLYRASSRPQSHADLQQFMHNMKPFGTPDFERLTPRLQALSMRTNPLHLDGESPYWPYLREQRQPIFLPPSITTLKLRHVPCLYGLQLHLPASLTSAELGSSDLPSLSTIFERCQNLESLDHPRPALPSHHWSLLRRFRLASSP